MRQQLARLLWAAALSGCSLIYNPSNLPNGVDAAIDAPIADADPSKLKLDKVMSPPFLLEGAGQGGSQKQILVVYGMHMTKAAQVTITAANPMANVMLDSVSIADDGNSFAALVSAGYMDTLDETAGNGPGGTALASIDLEITMTQDGASPQKIAWKLKPLDEYIATGAQNPPPADRMFSRVATTNVSFNAGQGRVILRAVGDIDINGTISANAASTTGGAGGCDGGAAGANGACAGGGVGGGGGGGFAARGGDGNSTGGAITGDPFISIYDAPDTAQNKGGGGAGGGLAAGGGSGGVIELTAGGNLNARMINANGADGANSLTNGAGGGAGGAVVLRAGGMLTHATALTVNPGGGGTGLAAGGAGSIGRWRFDATMITGTPAPTPAGRRGPMIMRLPNPIVEANIANLTVLGKSGDRITLIAVHPNGSTESDEHIMGSDMFPVESPVLAIGLNTLCVIVDGGSLANEEAKNCFEVAFVP